MFEAFAEKGAYPEYRRILEEARSSGVRVGHSYGRQTT
jgi:hypothetical protein